MQPPVIHTKPPVPAGLLLSVLPYVLASVVLSAVPLIALAYPPSLSAPTACGRSDVLEMQNGEPPPPPMDRQASLPFLAGIDLSEAQQNVLFKLMHDKAPAIFENEKIVRKTMQEIHQLAMSEHFDAAKVRSLADSHGKALAELTFLHTAVQAQVWAVLSEEQRRCVSKQMEHPRRPFP
jgi:periplasmic protein CpxP/Spy